MLTMKTHREGEAEVYLYYHGIQVGTQFEGCRWGVAMRWSRRREGKGRDGMGTEEEGRTEREEGRNKGAVSGQGRAGQGRCIISQSLLYLPYLTLPTTERERVREGSRGGAPCLRQPGILHSVTLEHAKTHCRSRLLLHSIHSMRHTHYC